MLHNAMSVNDLREPMQHVYNKYCKGTGRRAFAIGCSMGAIVLANSLGVDGENSVLSGAVCVQAAIKKWMGLETFVNSLGGTYNRAMGKFQFDFIRANMDVLKPHFHREHGIDLEEAMAKIKTPTYLDYHQLITVNLNGYKDGMDYLYNCAPYHRMGNIKRPTLFLNALNDPFMGETVIDYDVFN